MIFGKQADDPHAEGSAIQSCSEREEELKEGKVLGKERKTGPS